jgi:hypothetical protein
MMLCQWPGLAIRHRLRALIGPFFLPAEPPTRDTVFLSAFRILDRPHTLVRIRFWYYYYMTSGDASGTIWGTFVQVRLLIKLFLLSCPVS